MEVSGWPVHVAPLAISSSSLARPAADAFRGPPGRPGTQPGAPRNVAKQREGGAGLCGGGVAALAALSADSRGGQDPPDRASNPGWHTAIIQV